VIGVPLTTLTYCTVFIELNLIPDKRTFSAPRSQSPRGHLFLALKIAIAKVGFYIKLKDRTPVRTLISSNLWSGFRPFL
jgi:hypothetical protein